MPNIPQGILDKIRAHNWVEIVSVPVDVLSEDLILYGLNFLLGRTLELKGYIDEKMSADELYIDGAIYFPEAAFTEFDAVIRRNPLLLVRHLIDVSRKQYLSLLDFTKGLFKLKCSTLENQSVIDNFNAFIVHYRCALTTLVNPLFVERYITEEIKQRLAVRLSDPGALNDYFLRLVEPSGSLSINKEKIEIHKLALDVSNDNRLRRVFEAEGDNSELTERLAGQFPDFWAKVNRVVNAYSFMGMRFLEGRPYGSEDLVARVRPLIGPGLEDKIQYFKSQAAEATRSYKTAVRELDIKGDFLVLVGLARNVTFLRTWRLEATNKAAYYARPLLRELAARMNLDYYDLIYLTAAEIAALFGGADEYDGEAIRRRKEGYVMFLVGGEKLILTGEALRDVKKKFEVTELEQKNLITGQIASKGVRRGRATVVSNEGDFGRLREGDILVAKMTTPDYLPFIDKCGGFVTDLGGFTSHAAIIAREMGKPCIVGTKVATRMIRSGDYVEVDANNGVVRILERAGRLE